jgi:two-component system sensor histidine kinase PilS (NtrC family)
MVDTESQAILERTSPPRSTPVPALDASTSAAPAPPVFSRAQSQAAVQAENWKLLQYFNYYRLAVSVLAGGIAIVAGTLPPLGQSNPELFLSAALTYAVLAFIAAFTIRLRNPDFDTHATLLSFADITFLTMLIHASGGVGSGLPILLAVAIVGASLMLGQKLTMFYASLAAIAMILEHSWGILTSSAVNENEFIQNFPQVGLFGIALYAAAFLGNMLSHRLRLTEALAERRGVDIANLAKINDLIIQRMQAGVLVCDINGTVRQCNLAAQKYLGVILAPGQRPTFSVSEAAPDLAIQLVQWTGNKPEDRQRKIFRSRAGYNLLPRFVALGDVLPGSASGALHKNSNVLGVLIFLEDMTILKQQAQQLKMAALARLTASIAHEIRNPLGAMSNAAQLLSETINAEGEEMRLVKIIDEQSKRMNVIVQNVTQLARRDKINPVRVALATWLDQFILQYCQTTFIPKETLVRVGGEGVTVCVDPDQFFQVVSNLSQNALRHSPAPSGKALIKLQAGVDADNRPVLDVIDWGSGVPAEIRESIFDPFFTTTPKGTGLGLYIARELCEGNGGSLDYFPGDGGHGSRFRVTFARSEECAEISSV